MSRKFIKFVLIVVFVFTSSYAYSSETLYDQHMKKGTAGVESGDFGAAEEEFRSALREKPDDNRALLLLGAVLNRKGTKEAEEVLKSALRADPSDPETNLELGKYYYRKAVYPEARDYFENTIDLAPSGRHASEAGNYLAEMKKPAGARLRLDVTAGLQYDSNVIIGSSNTTLPEGISGKSDVSALLYLKGRYDLPPSQNFRAGLSYSLYQSLHSKLSDFDITQHVLGVQMACNVSQAASLKTSYSYEYTYVGSEDYNYAHVVSPSLTLSGGRGLSTVLFYTYTKMGFMNAGLFQDNSDRTGSNNLFGVIQNFPLGGPVSGKAGYTYDRDSTRKDFWDYKGHKGHLAVTVPLPREASLDLYGEYYNKKYDGVGPFSPLIRKDEILTLSLNITKRLSEKLSVSAGQIYVGNSSNIEVFDYKRSISSVYVTARF